jgi:hypothetical protein
MLLDKIIAKFAKIGEAWHGIYLFHIGLVPTLHNAEGLIFCVALAIKMEGISKLQRPVSMKRRQRCHTIFSNLVTKTVATCCGWWVGSFFGEHVSTSP